MNYKNLPQLIYDRSNADVARARSIKAKVMKRQELTGMERREWENGLRGALNASDLNRITMWVNALKSGLDAIGRPSKVQPVRTFTDADVPYKQEIDAIRRNIINIRDNLYPIPEWRELHFSDTMSLDQLNAMEWDLSRCAVWLERIGSIYVRSGQENTASGLAWYLPE